MITEKEITAAKLSPTRKDFYQIQNELLDTAGKISERQDPANTNQSDPGIVLLKVLTAVADKLNYNIDKNILEAFMPSATQEEAMRKLCEMMGYNIKYYQSATTEATIVYTGGNTAIESITIPKFTKLTDTDNTITYVTTENVTISLSTTTGVARSLSVKVPCIQGENRVCDTNNNSRITLDLLDDNHRYYLPLNQVAENGIYINQAEAESEANWEKVDNLNTQAAKQAVWKFGFDSKVNKPYIQFPDDISDVIGNGIIITYIATSGLAGNISAKVLTKLAVNDFEVQTNNSEDITVTADDFTVTNLSAAMNGANIETINQAYNNYKKTIGTFDTLVTCRDYMNKVYQLMDETTNIPLASNAVVSDIRDDINRAITLCEFSENGIKYIDKSIETNNTKLISNFDLVLYPFKTIYGLNTEDEYTNSFDYTKANSAAIEAGLNKNKTISHNFTYPTAGEITCIKNYLKLSAKITTTYKVGAIEEALILSNIYQAIYANFNSRYIDFGEEIPFDTILEVIEKADERIKNVSLDEPEIYTAIQALTTDGTPKEYSFETASESADITTYKKYLNKLILRNILAGKIQMFEYNEKFKPSYDEHKYGTAATELPATNKYITKLVPSCTIPKPTEDTPTKLTENEVVVFRAPNFNTTVTYPSYVNYSLKLNDNASNDNKAILATFYTFTEYLNLTSITAITDASGAGNMFESREHKTDDQSPAFTKSGNTYTKVSDPAVGTSYYHALINIDSFVDWNNYIKDQNSVLGNEKLNGFYIQTSTTKAEAGKLITSIGGDYYENKLCSSQSAVGSTTTPQTRLKVQHTWTELKQDGTEVENHTTDGLGRDKTLRTIPKDCEYRLKSGENLVFQYTKSTDSTGSSTYEQIDTYCENDIIRPNFVLADNSNQTSYDKSITPTKVRFENNDTRMVYGYTTLGSNQQIEIRKQTSISLYSTGDLYNTAYVYWELNKESLDPSNPQKFPFDTTTGKYMLKDNEYFYYTNQDQLELIYYGSGSEIQRIGNFDLESAKTANKVTMADIVKYGMTIIPWVIINSLSTESGKEKNIQINEYQYVNLTSGDKLISIDTDATAITSTEKTCNAASYKLGDDGSLTSLPIIDCGTDESMKQKVYSRLSLNVGPVNRQTLGERDQIEVYGYTSTTGPVLEPAEITKQDADTIKPAAGEGSISIKTNYILATSQAEKSVRIIEEHSDGTADVPIDDFSIKIFKIGELRPTTTNETVDIGAKLNNFGDYQTVLDTDDIGNGVKLNTEIADNCFGLIMFYNIASNTETKNNIYLKVSTGSTGNLVIYNNIESGATAESQWSGYKITNNYHLRSGINIVKIPNTIKSIEVYKATDTPSSDKIIFSDLDIVKGINHSSLVYYKIDTGLTDDDQLLKDIREIDPKYEFYYNTIVDNSQALEINTDLNETIASPRSFYDYNNVNNKFVISEISVTDMKKGITIARSSKI